MIQFNLLPDVKLEYVRVQRIKHTVISASIIAAGSAFAIFLLLFVTVHVFQKKNMSDLSGDITKYSTQLKNTPDLDKILTIQNQLGALPELHSQKAAASRTFKYIQQITPAGIEFTDLTTDYAANTMTIQGQAPSLDKLNVFADTMKFTKYTDKNVASEKAFKDVVLSQFTRSTTGTTFTLTATYDPMLFNYDNTDVSLTIPNAITTPSVVNQPAALFKKPVTNKDN